MRVIQAAGAILLGMLLGCRHAPAPKRAQVSQCSLDIIDTLGFDESDARLRAQDADVLAAIAAVLVGTPQIELVEVKGFVDGGPERKRRALAQARAEAVRDALVAKGVASERLTIEAHDDPAKPCEVANEACFLAQRYVSFRIARVTSNE